MHLFGLTMFFVAALGVGVECTLMVVVLTEGKFGKYALIEPTTLTGSGKWMKSTQTVNDGYLGVISPNFTSWKNVAGKLCGVRFLDENAAHIESLIGPEFLSVRGRIEGVTDVATTTPLITLVFDNPVSITQDRIDPNRMQFLGFKFLSAIIVLPLQTHQEKEFLESFKEAISASVEFTVGSIKNPVLLQILPYQPILFNGASFRFFNYLEVTQTDETQKNYEIIYNQAPHILTESNCSLKLVTPSGTKYALGMFNLLDNTGNIWIQSVWDGGKKLDVNTTEMFDKLKDIQGRSITDAIAKIETTDSLGSFPPSKWVTVFNYSAYFEPFTKKLNFKFNFGAEIFLYFLDGELVRRVMAYNHNHKKIHLLTFFGKDLKTFEDVRSRTNPEESFKVVPSPVGIEDSKLSKEYINLWGVRIIFKLQDNLMPDSILKRPFCQYTYQPNK